jgi:hypothetical protein
MTAGMIVFANSMVSAHNRISLALLRATKFPLATVQPTTIYRSSAISIHSVLITPSPAVSASRSMAIVAGCALVLMIGCTAWGLPFLRGFAGLALIAFAVGFHAAQSGAEQYPSAHFSNLWIRMQVVSWLVLPCIVIGNLALHMPNFVKLFCAVSLIAAACVAWSGIRMAAGIALTGVIGPGALPAAVLLLGPICDLLSILVFCSTAMNWQ